jgi:hypothetical protein
MFLIGVKTRCSRILGVLGAVDQIYGPPALRSALLIQYLECIGMYLDSVGTRGRVPSRDDRIMITDASSGCGTDSP